MLSKRPQTLQDYFDVAWRHAVVERQPPSWRPKTEQERAPASFGTVVCLYRGPDGHRCLIGAAIADEDYRPAIESRAASVVLREIGYTGAWQDGTSVSLDILQDCHDDAVRATDGDPVLYSIDVEERLRKFAERCGLTIPQEPACV